MTPKQAIPSSITGREGAPAESVLDHAFGAGDPYTLGVEEEYQLLDSTTFDLVQHIDTILAAVSGHELEEQINAELMQSVLEIATPVCRTSCWGTVPAAWCRASMRCSTQKRSRA